MKLYKDTQNNVFGYEEDGSQDDLIGQKIQITKEEADALDLQRQQQQFNSLSYVLKRQSNYPLIGDQLDALFHAGLFPEEMAKKIQAVKDQFPKP